MNVQDIKSEQNLRDWLGSEVINWNRAGNKKVGLDWIEPTFGSSMGISDCAITYSGATFGVELKHLYARRDGAVCYKIRPVQRRYNFMGVKAGRKLLLFASVAKGGTIELVLIRGDKLPLRDYCHMEGSGCETHLEQVILRLTTPFSHFLRTITDNDWWRQS